MYTIVGLGNPGGEYKDTRHNAGRIVIENIRKNFDASDWKEDIKTKAIHSISGTGKNKILFVFPNNFMNNSGKSVAPLIQSKKPARLNDNSRSGGDLSKLVVIYDDLDISLGKIKLSFDRSSGGHNGLESIIKSVKSKEFLRIRVGIMPTTPTGKSKKPQGEKAVIDFLMKDFKEPEIKELKKVSKRVAEVIEIFVNEGKEKAMGVGNTN